MSSQHQKLAARFRTSFRRQQAEQNRSEEAERERVLAAERARDELLVELQEFAEAAEFFDISETSRGFVLKFQGRRLKFERDRREPTVVVDSAHLKNPTKLVFHPSRKTWQVVTAQGNRKSAVDLYPQGLERLITAVFDIRPAQNSDTDRRENRRRS